MVRMGIELEAHRELTPRRGRYMANKMMLPLYILFGQQHRAVGREMGLPLGDHMALTILRSRWQTYEGRGWQPERSIKASCLSRTD